MNVEEIAKKANVSRQTVYNRAKELGRLPSVEECTPKQSGRPRKYFSYEEIKDDGNKD